MACWTSAPRQQCGEGLDSGQRYNTCVRVSVSRQQESSRKKVNSREKSPQVQPRVPTRAASLSLSSESSR